MTAVPGIESARQLAGWLDANVQAGGELRGIDLIKGGRSNLTYRLGWGDSDLVLRRPPLGHVLPTAHDMSREYKILTALDGTRVPVPGTVAFCADAGVIGAPFYIMRHVRGAVLRTEDDTASLSERQAARLSEQLADMLAAIHGVDIRDGQPLRDLGRGAGYMRRQLDRWQRQWALSTDGGTDSREYDRLVARLAGALPPDGEVTLVHGDFRLDNTLVTTEGGPAIQAVVDWEMATLGDPLADLGLTLTYWVNPGEAGRTDAVGSPTATRGFFTRDAFAARYAEATGRDVSGIGYYTAFGCFKLAVVLQGIHARFLQHKTVGEGFEREGEAVPGLIARAHRILDGE